MTQVILMLPESVVREAEAAGLLRPEASDSRKVMSMFRQICTVTPTWVDSAHRVASLTTVARQAMQLQFFRFFARVELDPGIFETAE